MRLPVTPQISTKDGVSNKNARLTNVLKEVRKTGELAVVRPGLSLSTTYAGLGNGLIVFDGRLLVMVDDTIYDTEWDGYWPLDGDEWNASSTYCFGDSVWYSGALWIWYGDCGSGVTPGTGYWYASGYSTDTYSYTATYSINDTVSVMDETYYAQQETTGESPLVHTTKWKTSPAPIYVYTTLNPSDKGVNVTLSNGNLTASMKWDNAVRSIFGVTSGKWYWEVTIGPSALIYGPDIGVANSSANLTTALGDAPDSNSIGYVALCGNPNGWIYGNWTILAYVNAACENDIIGVALNADDRTVSFYYNGTLQTTENLSDGGIGAGDTVYAAVSGLTGNNSTDSVTVNFGATAFTYSVPSGYNSGLYEEIAP